MHIENDINKLIWYLYNVLIQEKQLKKVRAKQKRLQAILGGEDAQRVEAELLAECDEDEGNESFLMHVKEAYRAVYTWCSEIRFQNQWFSIIFVFV